MHIMLKLFNLFNLFNSLPTFWRSNSNKRLQHFFANSRRNWLNILLFLKASCNQPSFYFLFLITFFLFYHYSLYCLCLLAHVWNFLMYAFQFLFCFSKFLIFHIWTSDGCFTSSCTSSSSNTIPTFLHLWSSWWLTCLHLDIQFSSNYNIFL